MVDALLARFPFSQVRIIPAHLNPHKSGTSQGAEPHHRLAMLRETFKSRSGCLIDPREALRPGPSYTFDTVSELHAENPSANITLVIGADNLRKLPDWNHFTELCPLVDWAVFRRPNHAVEAEIHRLSLLNPAFSVPHVIELNEPASSTEIRSRIQDGLLYEHLLPDTVLSYIRTHHLYGHSQRTAPSP